MTPKCKAQVERVMGRQIGPQEVAAIDRQMGRSMRILAKSEPNWKGLSKANRLERAAEQVAKRQTAHAEQLQAFVEANPETLNQPADGAPAFFSALERFISSHSQAKASADQWKGIIAKAPGIKSEEVEWTGVNDWLDAQEGSITRDDLSAFLADNGVSVEEVTKGGAGRDGEIQRRLLPLIEERDSLQRELDDAGLDIERDREVEIMDRIHDLDGDIERLEAGQLPVGESETKWGGHTLPGGENYTELLLTLPAENTTTVRWKTIRPDGQVASTWDHEGRAELEAERIGGTVRRDETAIQTGYRSSHWSELNVLAHVRFKERAGPNGERVLAIEEIQSDWHQDGRKGGYDTPERRSEIKAEQERINAEISDYRKQLRDLRDHKTGLMESVFVNGRKEGSGLDAAKENQDRFRAGLEARGLKGLPYDHPNIMSLFHDWIETREVSDVKEAEILGGIKIFSDPTHHDFFEDYIRTSKRLRELDATIRNLEYEGRRSGGKVTPNAPFKNNAWVSLALKRMVRHAAENGFDSIAWIPGNIQNGSEVDAEDGRSDFYDKIVPNLANKIGKKYGAKVGQAAMPITSDGTLDEPIEVVRWPHDSKSWTHSVRRQDGTEALHFAIFPTKEEAEAEFAASQADFARDALKFYSLPITPELKEAALNKGFPLFQPADGDARAQVSIPGGFGVGGILNDGETLVRLTKAADQTSFLHESAHIFLEIYSALEGQSPVIDEQMAAIRKWLKIEPGAPITREQHEKFADSFELYLMEGKAPNAELRSVFARFRQWFINVYRSMRHRLTKLDPEAIEIFDRMLATEEEISLAREDYQRTLSGYMSNIMSEEQLEKYKDAADKARQVAFDKLFRKHMAQVNRKNKAEYKRAKADLLEANRTLLEAEPVYKARKRLETDKMDLAELRGYRAEGFDDVAIEGGVHPEIVAADAGFASADEMLTALETAPDLETVIADRTERELIEQYGDLLVDGSAEQEAVEAVFNEPSIRMLEAERDALAALALKDPVPLKVIRAEADRRINELPIKDVVKPGRYAIEARTLHRRAVQNVAKGNYELALTQTHRAMLMHEMARRAYKAREEIGRIDRHLQRYAPHKFTAKKVKDKVDPAYVDAIRTLMTLPGIDPAAQAESIQKLNAFAEKQQTDGNVAILPTAVVLGGPVKDRRDMSMTELRDYKSSLQSLRKVGGDLSAEARAERTAYAEQIVKTIRENWEGRPAKSKARDPGARERAAKAIREVDALVLRYPFLIEALQGGATNGELVRELELALRQKLTDRNDRRVELGKKLVEIFESNGITQDELRRKHSVKEVEAAPVSFERIMAIAMNMGTQSNRDRLASDPSIEGDLDAIDAMLEERLEKRHWNAVQEVWDLLETLWPETVELEKRVSGVAPVKVESRRVETKHGSYRGGYFPISYRKDVAANKDIAEREQEDRWKAMTTGIASRASTPQGRIQERQQNVTRPLELSLETILRHIDDATTDIYLREESVRLDRLFRHPLFREAIEDTQGIEYSKTLETVLKRTVAGTEKAQDRVEGFFRGWRVNSSVAILGWNIKTALLAPVSYLQTVIPRYGPKIVLTGMSEFYGGPLKANRLILEKSAFMRERRGTYSREAHELVRKTPFQSSWGRFQGRGYWLMAYIEKWSVSGPVWLGVYRDGLAEGLSDADAVTMADRAIATTQGSGLEIDQSILQGGTEFHRNLTFMWGYLSGYYGTIRNDIASKDGFAKVVPAFYHLMLMNMAAATLEALVRGEAWDDDDDPFVMEVLNRFTRNITGLVPGVGSFFSRYDTGPPALQTGKEIVDAGRSYVDISAEIYEQGYVDAETQKKAFRQTLKAVGFGFGVPGTVQVDQELKALFDENEKSLLEKGIEKVTGEGD